MLKTRTEQISGWGRYPQEACHLVRPEKYKDLHAITSQNIARGAGRSYGDASLNKDHTVILTARLNRFLAFDKVKGLLTVEAGVTLQEILEVIVKHGWFLPVTPGTQFVTVGGCVACDVHGKNHHREGGWGNYVAAIELITADHRKTLCTPQSHGDLFWATIGGMGLTGIIGVVVLKLMPLASSDMIVSHHAAEDLEQTFLYLSDAAFDDHYTVAWVDTFREGKGIVISAHHAHVDEISIGYKRKNPIPKKLLFDLPEFFMHPAAIKLFNALYFRRQARKKYSFVLPYQSFFYPLDTISQWNRLYGKRGFIQYQCVFPSAEAYAGIKKIFALKHPSFLAVLKRFGKAGKGLLSFPLPGYTLALDVPFRGEETLKALKVFDEIVLTHGGRIYLAKDAVLSPENFRHMYPQYAAFLAIKQKIDPENLFQSSLSRRLKIGDFS
jgi:decaprenylphospho-beta-D-ribofuranose 2-oxidase